MSSLQEKESVAPLADWVAIEPVDRQTQTESGLYLPDVAAEARSTRGRIVAVGPGRTLSDGRLRPLAVQVGQEVLYPFYGGQEVGRGPGKKAIRFFREEELLARIENDTPGDGPSA